MSIENNNKINRSPDSSASYGADLQQMAEEAREMKINSAFFAGTKAEDKFSQDKSKKEAGAGLLKSKEQMNKEKLSNELTLKNNELMELLHLEQNKETREKIRIVKAEIEVIKKELYA